MFKEFLTQLENGSVRSAIKQGDNWEVNLEVKQGILNIFKNSKIIKFSDGFIDKEYFYPKNFTLNDQIRIVPGGTSIRPGSYIGKGVVIMPPSYINIGSFIDDSTMVDSHVLVGSCAQVGKRVHLSVGVKIGGVLEPIGERPVIIEDDAFIGAGAILVEGVLVREKAVIAPGVILSKSVPIYDAVYKKFLQREVPKNAVVVPGTRELKGHPGFSLSCPVIVKYRDEKTDLSLKLEDLLR